MRDEEGCPFGQQAETGRHRSFDVPTPPFTGTGPVTSSNKVRHAASAAPLPAPARARTRFRQFPPGHALLLPLAHTACEHRIGPQRIFRVHIPRLLLPRVPSCPLLAAFQAVLWPFSSTLRPNRPLAHTACVRRIGLQRVFHVHIPRTMRITCCFTPFTIKSFK